MTSSFLDWIRSLSWSDANVRGTAYAVVATLALIVALRLLAGVFRKLRERYKARIEARQLALRVQEWEVFAASGIERSVRYLLGFLHLLAAVVLIDIYVTLVLRLFPATEPLSGQYFELVIAPLVVLSGAVVAYLPDLIYIVAFSTVTFFSLKFLHLFFRALEAGTMRIPGFYKDWADPTYKLVRALVLVFLLIAIFPHLPGSDEDAFTYVSLFIGALVTLGSTAAVGNAVAGVVLIYTRAFQVGDWIRVGSTTGEVTRRTILVTRLRNTANEQVTIPNSEVLRDHVVNFSPAAKAGRLGLSVSVTLGYNVDWRTVESLLLKAAKATAEISLDPPPTVLQTSFDDFGVSYLLRVCTGAPPPLGEIRTALGRNILDEFNRAGVEILTPGFSVLRDGGQLAIPGTPDGAAADGLAGEGESADDEEQAS